MTILTAASQQWLSRPSDERFLSLPEMHGQLANYHARSRQGVLASKSLNFYCDGDAQRPSSQTLMVAGNAGVGYQPSHWAFGQLASLVNAPAKYLRRLPAPLVADMLTYGYQHERASQDTGVLIRAEADGPGQFLAATGPNYGRIWNKDVVEALMHRFGDGRTGDFKVPGEFGRQVEITNTNTTLYASDRDMFVFLADEENRVTLPNRRDGHSGSLARGFFIWNSEVGNSTLGVSTFLFDYACKNRIVWGAQMVKTVKIRHTASAPDKFIEQIQPLVAALSHGSAKPWEDALVAAQRAKVDDLDAWLLKRGLPEGTISQAHAVHKLEEGRPMETIWDTVVGLTAVAREYKWQDSRVALETKAGELLDCVERGPMARGLVDLDL